MKPRGKKALTGVVIAALALAVLLGCGDNIWNGYWEFQEKQQFVTCFDISLRPKNLSMETLCDDHGGFHGDGDAVYRVDLNGLRPLLEGWEELPLPRELLEQAERVQEEGEHNLLTEYVPMDAITGQWKFVSRSEERYGSEWRYQNWSLCIYDENQNVFYWLECDS